MGTQIVLSSMLAPFFSRMALGCTEPDSSTTTAPTTTTTTTTPTTPTTPTTSTGTKESTTTDPADECWIEKLIMAGENLQAGDTIGLRNLESGDCQPIEIAGVPDEGTYDQCSEYTYADVAEAFFGWSNEEKIKKYEYIDILADYLCELMFYVKGSDKKVSCWPDQSYETNNEVLSDTSTPMKL